MKKLKNYRMINIFTNQNRALLFFLFIFFTSEYSILSKPIKMNKRLKPYSFQVQQLDPIKDHQRIFPILKGRPEVLIRLTLNLIL